MGFKTYGMYAANGLNILLNDYEINAYQLIILYLSLQINILDPHKNEII